jgi:hypothetical protein
MIRRVASAPIGSFAGTAGASNGHHATTGVSGSSSGITQLAPSSASCPYSRSTTTSLAPASPPTRIWASSRGAAFFAPRATTITRHGCSRLASLAALMASSVFEPSSMTMTSVNTRPSVTAPPSWRTCTSLLLTFDVVVDGRS